MPNFTKYGIFKYCKPALQLLTLCLSLFVSAQVNAQTDISVVKTVVTPQPFAVGDTVTFTVTVTNNGLTLAQNVLIIDTIQSGYSFVDATSSQGIYNNNPQAALGTNGYTWSVGDIQPAQNAIMFMRLIYQANGNHFNTALFVNPADPNQNNNTSTVVPATGFCELSIVKDVDTAFASIGDTVTFTVTITNTGLPINDVFVIDNLPYGFDFVSSSTNLGYYDVINGRWDIVNSQTNPTLLASGAQAILSIAAKVVVGGFLVNTATLYAPCGSGIPPSDTAGVFVSGGDLSLTKTVSDSMPTLSADKNTTIKFTIKVKNEGFIPCTNVTVVDTLSSFYHFLNATPSAGTTYDNATHIWTIGNIAVGATATLDIEVEFKGNTISGNAANGDYDNIAQIKTCNEFDVDSKPGNNIAIEDDYSKVWVRPSGIIIPDGFSPNADGTNDMFVIENPSPTKLIFKVYNRWGNLVYENNDYKNDWNGKFNKGSGAGSDLPDGTYFYQLTEDKTGGNTYTKYLTIRR